MRISRRVVKWALIGVLAVGLGYGIVQVGPVVLFMAAMAYPTNARDNRDPAKQLQMQRATLRWARLAPLPTDARRYTISTEGLACTRGFHMRFTASSASLRRWIAASPGLRTATVTHLPDGRVKYIITPADGAALAWAKINPHTGKVEVRAVWS